MKITNPIQAEILSLMSKLENGLLTKQDCDRITALSIEMNKLNPKFEVIEFVEDKGEPNVS